jgi:polyisoprenoid-binding protein YceI
MRMLAAAILIFSATGAEAASWQVDAAKSKLGYMVVWDREPFKGEFRKWTADIEFDPMDLSRAKAKILIDIASMTTEDPENDKYRNGPNGLDAAKFAEARFVTKNFRAVSPGRYEAIADLSIHGVTKEVRLPFALSIAGNTAHMTGELTLSRIDYGVGKGNTFGIDWASERSVAHAVKVTVDLVATRRP